MGRPISSFWKASDAAIHLTNPPGALKPKRGITPNMAPMWIETRIVPLPKLDDRSL
jgi:hypothetical protein